MSDDRFTVPLYTTPEAARFVGVPPSTFSNWARGYLNTFPDRPPVSGDPIVTSLDGSGRHPAIPFVGLAEGMVVAAFRKAGVSLQHIRRAVEALRREMGVEHALASKRLFTDGASVLFDYARTSGDEQLTHVVTQQRVFAPVVADYLRLVTWGHDGWPTRLVSPATATEVVAVDPTRSFGQPIFLRGGVRVEDVLDRIRADERPSEVAADTGVPLEDIDAVLSAELRRAA